MNIILSKLTLFVLPVIYVLHISKFHRLCERMFNPSVTQIIKTLTPDPSEFTFRSVLFVYSVGITVLIIYLFFTVIWWIIKNVLF